jgi:hypothetical protein
MLYHRGLINRFAFFRAGRPGEFNYYLDNTASLELLAEQGSVSALDFEEVRRNKEKDYAALHDPARAEDMEGRRLFLKHEVMISRFHATLELAAQKSAGAVKLTQWQQGPQLWSSVEDEEGERLPHRPDAYFALRFKNSLRGDSEAHFFYEADRKTTPAPRHNRKLRAHFQFIVKQKLHELKYGVKRIRAVLIETIDDAWADHLRQAAGEREVSGSKPTPLFWFTTSTLLTKLLQREGEGTAPAYLAYPEIIFKPIWASPVDNNLYSLLD